MFAGGIGWQEILLLLLLAVLLFGTKKLPSIGRSAGKGLRKFKDQATSFKEPLDEVKQIRKVAALGSPRKALTKAIFAEPEETPKPAPSEAPTET